MRKRHIPGTTRQGDAPKQSREAGSIRRQRNIDSIEASRFKGPVLDARRERVRYRVPEEG
jgi:hypothetical protein